jgi:hypothetical protein
MSAEPEIGPNSSTSSQRGARLVFWASVGSLLTGLPLIFTPPLAIFLDVTLSLPHLWLIYRFARSPKRWDIPVAVLIGLIYILLAAAPLLAGWQERQPLWELALRAGLLLCQPLIVVGAVLAEGGLAPVAQVARPAHPRWLAIARVAAIFATIFAGLLLNADTRRPVQILWTLPFLLPYLIILVSLRKEPRKLGLGLAVGLGLLGAGGGGAALLLQIGHHGSLLELGFWGLLTLLHAVMVLATLCARPVEAAPAEPLPGEVPLGDPWLKTVRAVIWLSLFVLLVALLLTFLDLTDPVVRVPAGWFCILALLAAPYVAILILLKRGHCHLGLATAAAWGAIGVILWLAIAPLGLHTRYAPGSGFISVAGMILSMAHLIMTVSAGGAYSRLGRAPYDGRVVLGWFAPVLFGLCLIVWVTSPAGERSVPRQLGGGMNESSAVGSIRTIITGQVTYYTTYPDRGFAASLSLLGPPPEGQQPSPEAADYIDFNLAQGEKNGYRFTLVPGPPDPSGKISTFVVHARPIVYERTGLRSFRGDDSGIIRFTAEDRLVTEADPPIP